MLDDAFDQLQGLREGPVWRPMPQPERDAFGAPFPREGEPAAAIYDAYDRLIAPYATGNRHPGFFGWVHGAGTPIGMLAEMLAGGLDANLGGRDHAPILCERQVVRWAAEMLGFPADASGVLVTGTSVANLMAVIVARTAALGQAVRALGVAGSRLLAYASPAAHGCVSRALDMAGLGRQALRLLGDGADAPLEPGAVRAAIARDRREGGRPFMVIGTAGTVDTGAVDDLAALAAVCRAEDVWFHVDAAYGALAMLSDRLRPLLAGIEQAHSVAFDFHKWAQVPYDAGCLVVRDAAAHRAAFAQPASYLARSTRGLAAGDPWPCDFGPDLSRGFRALKIWMTLKHYGAARLGQMVERTCDLARHLADRVEAEPALELSAQVTLNIACFRCVTLDDRAHAELAADIQESGVAAPSITTLGGRTVLRAAIVNHRTEQCHVDALLDAVIAGAQRHA
jgi:glutamate/tyrosine decarboxylase-like PLP-dependent enzyme